MNAQSEPLGASVSRPPIRSRRLSSGPGRASTKHIGRSKPPLLLWVTLVFVLLIQQDAFIDMPALTTAEAAGATNAYNTVTITLSFGIAGVLFVLNAAQIGHLARRNKVIILYIAIVLMSTAWSIHPDLTLRRGCGYLLSMLIAAYLTVRFNSLEQMKLLSASFAFSAVCSFLYAVAYPQYGIMHSDTLTGQSVEGMWRGVFPHKNVLGPVMAIAVFTELYILVASRERPLWRFVLLGLFLALIALSISATALTASATYLAAAGGYLLWRRDRRLGVVAALVASIFLLSIIALISIAPEYLLAATGKDIGLTGRTDLWGMVVQLIGDRPVFGYGYRSMWLPNDTFTVLADQLTGGYGVTNSENAFLEMTLELGAAGMSIILAIFAAAFWRSAQCCLQSITLLGWFSFVFFAMSIVTGLTSVNLGQNQAIPWLTFTILFLSCGRRLTAEGGMGNQQRVRFSPTFLNEKRSGSIPNLPCS
jgi:exopolysaccharide production protein ExoQ